MFKLGCDPEVFLQLQNKYVTVCDRLNGADKHNPFQIPDLPEGFKIHEDNVALEMNIPPATNKKIFVKNVQTVMKYAKKYVPGIDFSKESAVSFSEDSLKHPRAQVFGCDPDYNAWTKRKNPKPQADDPNLRSAGGHVHVSHSLDPLLVTKAMDLYLLVPSLIMDKNGWRRRQLYGGLGAFRPKPYGSEYRSLSNFWIFKPSSIEWVWDQTVRAVEEVEQHGDNIIANMYEKEIHQAVKANDMNLAKAICQEFDIHVS